MIKISAYSTRRSFYSLGMAGTPAERLALPGVNPRGEPARMPVTKKQFEACRSELKTLTRRSAVRFEASNGATSQEVTLEQVAEFFGKQKEPAPEPLPPPRMVPRADPPQPAPWMPPVEDAPKPEPEASPEDVPNV